MAGRLPSKVFFSSLLPGGLEVVSWGMNGVNPCTVYSCEGVREGGNPSIIRHYEGVRGITNVQYAPLNAFRLA